MPAIESLEPLSKRLFLIRLHLVNRLFMRRLHFLCRLKYRAIETIVTIKSAFGDFKF